MRQARGARFVRARLRLRCLDEIRIARYDVGRRVMRCRLEHGRRLRLVRGVGARILRLAGVDRPDGLLDLRRRRELRAAAPRKRQQKCISHMSLT